MSIADIASKAIVVAENAPKVYEAGQKTEHDRFWDVFQDYGNRTDYVYAYCGQGWNETTFMPKYPVTVVNGHDMFRNSGFVDLKKHCADNGIVIDLSKATSTYNLLYGCSELMSIPDSFGDVPNTTALDRAFYSCPALAEVPVIDSRSCKDFNRMFNDCFGLVTVHGIDFTANTGSLGYVFQNCYALKNLTINGTIKTSGLNLSWSTELSHDSLMSVTNALEDYSGSGATYTVTLGTNNLAKLTAVEKVIATQKGWTLA